MQGRLLLALAVILTVCALAWAGWMYLNAPEEKIVEPAKDYYQRSLQIYEFKQAADHGMERGREIFYYKCWFCHNEFVKSSPQLDTLFTRATMIFGQPVTDENVRKQILDGSPGMAAYKHTLSKADLDDLMAYLKSGECCWDSDAPPPNPLYRFSRDATGRATGE